MEEELNIDKWLINNPAPVIEYAMVYDPESGQGLSIGPSHAFESEKYKIPVDSEKAELIIEGKIRLSSCFVDFRNNSLEITEVKNIFKIDDVLHRVISRQWTEIDRPDIYITYDKAKCTMKFELTEEFNGTKKMPKKYQPVSKRKVLWDGETVMNFLITEYNDPNILYSMLAIKISDLSGKSKTIKNLELPDKFSLYTRRVFKNYIIEHK